MKCQGLEELWARDDPIGSIEAAAMLRVEKSARKEKRGCCAHSRRRLTQSFARELFARLRDKPDDLPTTRHDETTTPLPAIQLVVSRPPAAALGGNHRGGLLHLDPVVRGRACRPIPVTNATQERIRISPRSRQTPGRPAQDIRSLPRSVCPEGSRCVPSKSPVR